MKMIEDMTWEELEDHLVQYIHSALLDRKGMKSAVSYAMQLTLRWRAAQKI